MEIYEAITAKKIPHSNHYSDLYIPVTEETEKLLKTCGITTATTFTNQVEGGQWFNIPFAYLPYWEKRNK